MLSNKLFQSYQRKSQFLTQQFLYYTSRAHPKPTPLFTIQSGLTKILEGIEERKAKRVIRWECRERNNYKHKLDGPYRNQDETIELALNLNLDPRKPGQNLRGSVLLPNGTGKSRTKKILVFTTSSEVGDSLRALGISDLEVGEADLLERIVDGDLPVTTIERIIASQDMMGQIQKKAARLLGPRGLMPNSKMGTLVPSPDELEPLLNELEKSRPYRTDKEGIVHVAIGKGSMGEQKLMENLGAVIKEIYESKPESYGKSKKGSKSKASSKGQYVLRAHLGATQSRGTIRLDPRTVDPTSPSYMSETLKNI
mmetsp:Transcript_20727/g.31188  ORF Transcript_20727/g.31188 Transcript_20727/m.31188 type:complete len:311 (-) Transcript_20727:174-1106(-)